MLNTAFKLKSGESEGNELLTMACQLKKSSNIINNWAQELKQ